MDFGSPDTWRWIWLVAVVAFTVGELTVAGSFFLAPLAVGALVAALAAFAGVPVAGECALFLVASAASFAALRPLARRLELGAPHAPVGAQRWVGRQAHVLEAIPPHGTGLVRLDRESWRAESGTDTPIPAGSTVLVTRLDGTRLEVVPLELAPPETEGS